MENEGTSDSNGTIELFFIAMFKFAVQRMINN